MSVIQTIEVEHVQNERSATHVIIPIEAYRSAFSLLQDLPYRQVGGTMNALNATTRLVREDPPPGLAAVQEPGDPRDAL